METRIMERNPIESFIIKYKKWFIGGIGMQIIPFVIFMLGLMGAAIYSYVSSEVRWHPYQKYIYGGYNSGLEDGVKDKEAMPWEPSSGRKSTNYIAKTPWDIYETETAAIKENAVKEKEEYLRQFPESERSAKRAEMKMQRIKLPLELELEARFIKGIDFYADYVAKKIKRESYKSDQEYQQALKEEAWKAGYEYGHREGYLFGKSIAGSL